MLHACGREIGALNGHFESNTWTLERCLGWRGLNVEALPANFDALKIHRPFTANLRLAACATPQCSVLVGSADAECSVL